MILKHYLLDAHVVFETTVKFHPKRNENRLTVPHSQMRRSKRDKREEARLVLLEIRQSRSDDQSTHRKPEKRNFDNRALGHVIKPALHFLGQHLAQLVQTDPGVVFNGQNIDHQKLRSQSRNIRPENVHVFEIAVHAVA